MFSSVLSAVDQLSACPEVNTLLRLAVELARERLALERVGLYIRDRGADRCILRGTWGTGARGETTDERSWFHEIAPDDRDALLQVRRAGGLGMYRARAPLSVCEPGRHFVIGEGWIMATPLVVGDELVGVMYNDCAFTQTPMDETQQALAALFCTLLAALVQSKRGQIAWQPPPCKSGRSALVRRILRAVGADLPMTGDQLARELGVSPGYLARSFKREMGMSLVDYRNRQRMERFLGVMQNKNDSRSFLDAALQAGFGSYAQFHRVYRKIHGTSPRDLTSPFAQALQRE